MENEYIYHSEQFDGPLDVLLHLIQKAKVDIMDISSADLTDQYTQYIKSMQDLNLELAAEYLLMAVRLIEMKSRMLLPKVETEEELEADPRAELIQRLLEYRKYKEVTTSFRQFENERQQVFSKPISDVSHWIHDEILLNTEKKKDVYQLVKVFEKMLARQQSMQRHEAVMQKQVITIEEQLDFISTKIRKSRKLSLSELIINQSRAYAVTTFLAILQLVRDQSIIVKQTENFDDIELINNDSERF